MCQFFLRCFTGKYKKSRNTLYYLDLITWRNSCYIVQYNDLKGYFMKFSTALIFSISLIVSSHTNATLLTDVGGVDEFIASTTLKNSGDSTELNWAQETLRKELKDQSITLTLDTKDESGTGWTLIDDLLEKDIYSTKFDINPSYFLLKFGTGGTDIASHLLFKNVGDLSFGVIDFSAAGIVLSDYKNFSIGRLSHVDEFNANPTPTQGTTPIPEPMTISLFALALLGFARRK